MKDIGDMTLNEIRELKKQLADKLKNIVIKEVATFEAEYGLHTSVDVSIERYPMRTEWGDIIAWNDKCYASVSFIGE